MTRKRLASLAGLLLISALLMGCGVGTPESAVPDESPLAEETPPEAAVSDEAPAPTPTTAPTEVSPTAEPPAVTYVPAEIPEDGLILEVPETWARLGVESVWAPVAGDVPAAMVHPRLGAKMIELQPPAEAEAALLPQPSQTLESETIETALGSGRYFLMEVYGLDAEGEDVQADVISVEKHVLVTTTVGDRRVAYDLYVAAATPEELAQLDSVLAHMIETATITEVAVPEYGSQAALDLPAVAQAKARLAQYLGVSEDSIKPISAEFTEWRDACLGVREAGQMCAQVITPGYRIILESGGQQYEVHTNSNGTAVAIVSR